MEQALFQSAPDGLSAGSLKESVRIYERTLVVNALKANGEDKRKAAKSLGISLSSLYRKLSDLSLEGIDENQKREARKEDAEFRTAVG